METEHLKMGHQVIMLPEVLIMICLLPSHTFGHAWQQYIIKWKCYICDQTLAGPGGTNKLY